MSIYKEILSKPFDFNVNETAQLDGDKLDYPYDEATRKEVWRKRLKYMTLDKFVELQINQREKGAGKDTSVNKSDAQVRNRKHGKGYFPLLTEITPA